MTKSREQSSYRYIKYSACVINTVCKMVTVISQSYKYEYMSPDIYSTVAEWWECIFCCAISQVRLPGR